MYQGYKNTDVVVRRQCPKCSRFLKAPESIKINGLGEVKTPKGNCSRCGEVELDWDRFDYL